MTEQLSEHELSEDALDHVVAAFSALLEAIDDQKITEVDQVKTLAEGLIMKALDTMNKAFGGPSTLATLKLMEEAAPNVYAAIQKRITVVRVNPHTGETKIDD